MKPSELKPYFGFLHPSHNAGGSLYYTPQQMAEALESAMAANDEYHRCGFNDWSERAKPHQEWLARIEELREGK